METSDIIQGFLYSDETHASRTLFALMKTLLRNEEKAKTRTRNEKYEIHIWIMSSIIRRYPDCWFELD